MYAATNGQSGTTSSPSRRASSSAVATSRLPSPRPSSASSTSVWVKAIRPSAPVVGGLADHPARRRVARNATPRARSPRLALRSARRPGSRGSTRPAGPAHPTRARRGGRGSGGGEPRRAPRLLAPAGSRRSRACRGGSGRPRSRARASGRCRDRSRRPARCSGQGSTCRATKSIPSSVSTSRTAEEKGHHSVW